MILSTPIRSKDGKPCCWNCGSARKLNYDGYCATCARHMVVAQRNRESAVRDTQQGPEISAEPETPFDTPQEKA